MDKKFNGEEDEEFESYEKFIEKEFSNYAD